MEDLATTLRLSRTVLFVTAMLGSLCPTALAQPQAAMPLNSPTGEAIQKEFYVPVSWDLLVKYSSKHLVAYGYTSHIDWHPPTGRDIWYVACKKDHPDIVFIALDDGSVYRMELDEFGWSLPQFQSKGETTFSKLVGDAIYGLSSNSISVSRDTGKTWKTDTSGLGQTYNYDVDVDNTQYAFLASSAGLFRQHPDSSIWRKVSSFPASFTTSVFCDRQGRLIAGSSGRVYLSTNGGATWTIDTVGLGGQSVTGFCDDVFGNIFAYGATRIWRSTGGTQPWVRVDQALIATAYDQTTNLIFNGIHGDSVLAAATIFGSYFSTDRGATWKRDTTELNAESIYGLVKTASGKLVTSTSLGVYLKNPADLQWTKSYPPNGYLVNCPVFRDAQGNLYTLGSKINPSNFFSVRANWKSTDGGASWSPDTANIGLIGAGQSQLYYVDETGVQHYGGYDTPAKFYRKSPGQGWTVDTSGYANRQYDLTTAFGSDNHGNCYVATTDAISGQGSLLRRPIAGGAWVTDMAGLPGSIQVYAITADKAGNPIIGTYGSGVYRKSGSTWSQLPYPAGLNGYSAFVVSVDSGNNIIAGFSVLSGINFVWRGVYSTRNNGATWTLLGLDSISVRGLVSYGDSTYAYTYVDGLYLLRTSGVQATSVASSQTPQRFALEQNFPNPFNPSTTIRFFIPRRDRVSLKVFDVLGREVASLVDGEMESGFHQVQFAGAQLASGIYFYRLQSGSLGTSRKLVLLK